VAAGVNRSRRTVLLGVVVISIVGLLGFGLAIGMRGATGDNAAGRVVDSRLLGHPAPDFTLARLDGGRLSLRDERGHIAVLNFWASWCVPCRKEAPLLEAASRRWQHRGVTIIGVATRDTVRDARAFRREFRLTYPQVLDDGDGTVAAAYGVVGIPATIVVNAQGTVRATIFGQLHGSMLDDALRAVRQGKTVNRLPFGPLRSRP
jgi:cytochrome c biogenesis protein CcmG/thiol:disulfide interchange protein DsbE